MKKLSRIAAMALVAALMVSGTQVLADEHEEVADDTTDTVFNLAYDAEQQVLLWNISLSDGPYDCSLSQAGSLRATYGVSLDGVVPVTDLRLTGGDPVFFPNRPVDEVDEDFEPATDPISYTADGDCGLTGAEVAGPQGQVNHGTFMSLFNSLWEGPGRGCVNRYLAQSDFGKGDQQVQVGGDEVATEESEVIAEEPSIEFLTFAADCERGNRSDGPGNGNGNGNGNANGHDKDKAQGKPDSPGNSGNAPGHNK